MKKENRLLKYLESIEVKDSFEPILSLKELENEDVKNLLLTFDEFKGVKKINILSAPSYMGDINTKIPFEFDNFSIGGNLKIFLVPTFAYNPETDIIELNDEIDLFSITLSPEIYEPNPKLDYGLWLSPPLYHPTDFTPRREIKIIFSEHAIQDGLGCTEKEAKEELKNRVFKSLEKMFDDGLKTNLPCYRKILIRLSERSIKKVEKIEKDVATE